MAADDLAHPRLGQPYDAIARAGRRVARWAVSIESPAIVVGAMKRSNESDLDVGPIAEPLEILSRSLDREAGLHALGRIDARRTLRQLLATRARLVDLARRRPDVVATPIAPPIVVTGMPGAGTAVLHRLLARDPGLRHLPAWEARSPLPMGRLDDPDAPVDDRMTMARRAATSLERRAPGAHEGAVTDPDDDQWLLGVGLGSMCFEARWNVPAFAEWYDAADLGDAYRTFRDLLAVLQWYRPADRWVLRSPQHAERLATLLEVFPGATVVQVHRDPAAAVVRTAVLIARRRRLGTFDVSPPTIGRYWAWRIERLVSRSIDQRDATGANVVDVRFEDLQADPLSVVEEVYRAAGGTLSPEARIEMEREVREGPARNLGGSAARPEDVGLDPVELRGRFAGYVDRFGVTPD
jgi:hypothetical protein